MGFYTVDVPQHKKLLESKNLQAVQFITDDNYVASCEGITQNQYGLIRLHINFRGELIVDIYTGGNNIADEKTTFRFLEDASNYLDKTIPYLEALPQNPHMSYPVYN